MSTIKTYSVDVSQNKKGYKLRMERFESASEVVDTCAARQITDSSFQDVKTTSDWAWCGVESYENAMELMRTGYQTAVEEFKKSVDVKGNNLRRISFRNNLVGLSPVVPLALKNVPNCMIDMTMKPIKAKVIDVYYDVTASCGTKPEEIIARGKKLLGVIKKLELSGYRINLYGVQTYSDYTECDMLVVKLKSSDRPIDLKRLSFPLIHPSFFRVIGFDWYSKFPIGKYRSGYGCALGYTLKEEEVKELASQVFGKNSIFLTGIAIGGCSEDKLEEVIKNGDSKTV